MSQHHDPVHPDGEHLSAEVLADLELGLLDQESAAHARHHLEHCAACQQLAADLAAVTETLQGLADQPGEPMPESVWTQLSEAMAAAPVSTPEGSATVVPLAAERTRRRRPGIGLVAGAAGVALVGAVAVSFAMGGTAVNTASDDSGADALSQPEAASGAFEATRSGTQYRQEALDQQVIELVAARNADQAPADASATPSAAGTGDPSSSATPGSTPSVLDNDGSSPGPGSVISKLLRTAGPMATNAAAAQTCVEDYLPVQDDAPLAIDIGIWQGKPAAVIVRPAEGDPTSVEVWIINPTCDTASTQDPLYYFATVSR